MKKEKGAGVCNIKERGFEVNMVWWNIWSVFQYKYTRSVTNNINQ